MSLRAKYLRNKFWITDYFNGSPVGKPYRELKKFAKLSSVEAEKVRNEKLHALLSHAHNHTEFYAGYTSFNLKDYPVMNKSLLIENHSKIAVSPENIPGQVGKLHIQSTSGSTGTPFQIPQDTRKRLQCLAELKYFGEIVGFRTHDMLIHLRTWNRWQSKTPKQIKKENIIPFDISQMGDKELGELCDLINKHKAVCLRGYASSFDLLARYIKENGRNCPSVKIIIAGSEALHDDVRHIVKENMGCEIISQYADEECGIMAQERIPTKSTDNPMYLNHADYIFECLKMDSDEPAEYGEVGRLVVTDLHNYAFPVIRYDTGDAAVMAPPDEHSNGFPVLGKLYGRRLDVCYTTKGEPFSPMTIGRILKHYNKIIQWQFIQKASNEYVLKVILSQSESIDYLNEAIQNLKETLGEEAIIIIEKVDGIPTLASGKRKPVINEWKTK
jgi:phenylacetate-CoA ligase